MKCNAPYFCLGEGDYLGAISGQPRYQLSPILTHRIIGLNCFRDRSPSQFWYSPDNPQPSPSFKSPTFRNSGPTFSSLNIQSPAILLQSGEKSGDALLPDTFYFLPFTFYIQRIPEVVGTQQCPLVST